MKIFQIDQHYGVGGGAEHIVLSITGLLEGVGHEVVMVYAKRGDQPVMNESRKSVQIPYLADRHNKQNGEVLRTLKELIEEENPDLIHIHNIRNETVIDLCSRLRPTIRHVQDPTFVCFRHWKLLPNTYDLCSTTIGLRCYLRGCLGKGLLDSLKLIMWKRKDIRIHKKLDHLLVSSRYKKKLVEDIGISPKKVSVIHPAADIVSLSNEPVIDENIVLFVGKMHPIKGVEYLLHALPHVTEPYRVVLVGEGDFLERYRKLADELGVSGKVEFTGWVPHNEVTDYYRKCSLLVVPSIWVEAFGLIGTEAMVHERPVVAFNSGGIPDWLTDGENGFLVPTKDFRRLAEKISLLLKNKDLAREMGRKGRKSVEERFASENYLEKLLPIYEKAIANHGRR